MIVLVVHGCDRDTYWGFSLSVKNEDSFFPVIPLTKIKKVDNILCCQRGEEISILVGS